MVYINRAQHIPFLIKKRKEKTDFLFNKKKGKEKVV